MTDHTGVPLTHGRPRVNGVELHCATGGTGDPVVLIHGVPKTVFFWRHVIPLLTPHYTVVAVDLRGFGGSGRPTTGYDTQTLAADIAALMATLGHDRYRVVGEDRGAAVAYAVAAFHRPKVVQLVFQETRLPGLPVPDPGPLAAEDPRTGWHRSLFGLPHYPELLIAGRERAFWTYFMRRIMWNPSAYTDVDEDEYTRGLEEPGGNHAVFERAGHNIPLEAPVELGRCYLDFFATSKE